MPGSPQHPPKVATVAVEVVAIVAAGVVLAAIAALVEAVVAGARTVQQGNFLRQRINFRACFAAQAGQAFFQKKTHKS